MEHTPLNAAGYIYPSTPLEYSSSVITMTPRERTSVPDPPRGTLPSSAVPLDGRVETEGRRRGQLVTQLVLHHRLLQQEGGGEESSLRCRSVLELSTR